MVQEVLMYKSVSGPAFETREEAEEHDREEAWFNFAVRVLPLALEPRIKRRVAQLLRANATDLQELLDNYGEIEVTPPPEDDETPPPEDDETPPPEDDETPPPEDDETPPPEE